MLSVLLTWTLTAGTDPAALAGYDPDGGGGRVLYELEVVGTIDARLATTIEEVAVVARERDIILVVVNSAGGRVDAAIRIRDALLKTRAATVALVEPRALSAATLVVLACRTVLMARVAVIGAATPMALGDDGTGSLPSAKALSIMRAELRSTAEARGRPTALVEAMVDPSLGYAEIAAPGQVVTLTTAQALRLALADGEVADRDQAVAVLNLRHAERVRPQRSLAALLRRALRPLRALVVLAAVGAVGLGAGFCLWGWWRRRAERWNRS